MTYMVQSHVLMTLIRKLYLIYLGTLVLLWFLKKKQKGYIEIVFI